MYKTQQEIFQYFPPLCHSGLPTDRPRYLMGVGYTLDIICCVALGVDMFDCVYPTRKFSLRVVVYEIYVRLKS